jgi:hypothetical protein
VHQEAANLWQHDHADAALADQPLDRPPFATRIREMVAESLAPAWEVGRITANDLFHGVPNLAIAQRTFNEAGHHIGIRDEALQLVVVDDQHALYRILDHQARQIADFQVLGNL